MSDERSWSSVLLDAILPRRCAVCGDAVTHPGARRLCTACRHALATPPPIGCVRCGLPAPRPISGCDCPRLDPALRLIRAAATYDPDAPLGVAIRHFKYGPQRALAHDLGAAYAERFPFAADDVVLVPIPLHPRRLRERGFNQALLLARSAARRHGLALAPRALRRRHVTDAQSRLDAADRRRNVERAIAVRRPEAIRGRAVVLVDDVLTTGATAGACARVLRAAGATSVDCYVLARTP